LREYKTPKKNYLKIFFSKKNPTREILLTAQHMYQSHLKNREHSWETTWQTNDEIYGMAHTSIWNKATIDLSPH
jgi:hypothetical protein